MREYPTNGPIAVEIRTAAGTVEVHAEPRQTAEVDVAPYDDSDASREAAAQTRVDFSGDTLTVSLPEHSGWLWRRPPKVRVTARVPAGSSGRFRSATADLTCLGEWSQVRLNTASGDARVERTSGDLSVNTASGDLRVDQVGGSLRMNTASGDIAAQRVTGPVAVKSASGDVRIDQAAADVDVKTVSGDAVVGAARTGTVRAATVSGDATIGVVTGTGVWLDLNTLSGRTHSDLEMGGEQPASHDLTVHVRSVSGDIRIQRVTLPTPS